jgi:hypothetical protein
MTLTFLSFGYMRTAGLSICWGSFASQQLFGLTIVKPSDSLDLESASQQRDNDVGYSTRCRLLPLFAVSVIVYSHSARIPSPEYQFQYCSHQEEVVFEYHCTKYNSRVPLKTQDRIVLTNLLSCRVHNKNLSLPPRHAPVAPTHLIQTPKRVPLLSI